MSKSKFLAASSILALTMSVPAFAQQADQGDGAAEQVVVTASRISIAGYEQPTPVTVLGGAQIDQTANPDIGDTIRDLPAVGISSSPEKAGGGTSIYSPTAGASTINLRDLGVVRSLVLFDGQRVVASSVNGGVDLSTIPSALVDRIDVVTGGASAAWGSDAVAGVVNLILNKNFTGLKANIEGSDTGQDTRRAYSTSVSFGTDFDGDRGHLILSGSYQDSPQTMFIGQAHWWNSTFLLQPAGSTEYRHYNNVGQKATQGGVILSGPLANMQFTGNGTPTPYNPGVTTGTLAAGGSANQWTSEIPTDELSYPYHTSTLFAYGSFKLTPEIQASVQLNYGNAWSENDSTTALNQTLTIHNDNAYLPASVVSSMATAGVSTFTLATTNTNNVNMYNPSFSAFENSLGVPVNRVERELMRGVFSLDGALGDDWSWNVYYQHGESRVHSEPNHIVINANLTNAVDAVYVTAANVGASGLPVGSIACRSTLTNPTNGCQPLDVFGNGVASQGAINYINTSQDFEVQVLDQDVAAGSMQGVLPWNLTGAGRPSVAFGGEYRKEAGSSAISPLAAAAALNVGNFGSLIGHYSVEEGFLETDVPLIKDGFVENASLNLAGRITNYSTSGMVETWKLGLTSQINDDFRVRGTWSYDIRAPDLAELFQANLVSQATPTDPNTRQAVVGYTDTSGNLNLKPEEAVTLSGGVVMTPHWIDGLQVSVDWYSIDVHGYIQTPASLQETQFCEAGNQFYCGQFVYKGTSLFEYLQPQNASSLSTSGVDFQADYPMDFLTGKLALHLVGNYTDHLTISAFGAAPIDYAGQLGAFTGYTSLPKTRGSLSATYMQDAWQLTVQGRYLGSGTIDNAWTSGVQVDNNNIPQVAYLDLRGSYNWNGNIQFYAAIDNVLDTPPPTVAEPGTEFECQPGPQHQRAGLRRAGPHDPGRRPLHLLSLSLSGLYPVPKGMGFKLSSARAALLARRGSINTEPPIFELMKYYYTEKIPISIVGVSLANGS